MAITREQRRLGEQYGVPEEAMHLIRGRTFEETTENAMQIGKECKSRGVSATIANRATVDDRPKTTFGHRSDVIKWPNRED